MNERVCKECGADTWKAAGYDELAEARDRHWQKNREQAQKILQLELKVSELEVRQGTRQRKLNKQRRVIRRLEERLRELSAFPYEGFGLGETEPVPQTLSPQEDDGIGPSPRGMRLQRRRAKAEGGDGSEELRVAAQRHQEGQVGVSPQPKEQS